MWEWAARNLSAAAERLLSPAERMERAVGPWSTYVVLPLFAFSATGVSFAIHLSSSERLHILVGTVLGLVAGKPLGILIASAFAVTTRLATPLEGVTFRQFVGAACLCGVGDTLALLMADSRLYARRSGHREARRARRIGHRGARRHGGPCAATSDVDRSDQARDVRSQSERVVSASPNATSTAALA